MAVNAPTIDFQNHHSFKAFLLHHRIKITTTCRKERHVHDFKHKFTYWSWSSSKSSMHTSYAPTPAYSLKHPIREKC